MPRIRLNRPMSLKRPKGVLERFHAPAEYNVSDELAKLWTDGDDAPAELIAGAPQPAKRSKKKEG